MVCLPLNDPNQFDLFNNEINFGPEPSTAFPPNMQDIMDELNNPNAILPSPNIAVLDDVEANIGAAVTFWDAQPPSAERTDALKLFDTSNFDFAGDLQLSQFTVPYNAQFPPLLSNVGGIQDIINVARSHLLGIPSSIPGALGSLGQANAISAMSYGNAGNLLQRSLGLGAIPDCGLFDLLLGMLKNLLQPLIDLLAQLLGPLFDVLGLLAGILSAILAELLALLNLLQRLLNFANGNQLLNLDPCGLLNMAQIGAPSLNSAINTGITWKNPDLPQIPDPGDVF